MSKQKMEVQKGKIISKSDWVVGETFLTEKEQEMFSNVSKCLHDDYSSLLLQYSPNGLINVLRSQIKTKKDNESVGISEIVKAEQWVDLLEKSISFKTIIEE